MQGRDEVYSQKIRAGKRTYFFDVRSTRSSDYYITITESKKRFNGRGYDKHKIFLYKEDFNKFLNSLTETINHVKTELLPDYDYEEFDRRDREYEQEGEGGERRPRPKPEEQAQETVATEEAAATEETTSDESLEEISTSWED
ncbi:MAG: DUF3276 family protein [Bacteroidota bacterium]